RRGLHPRRDARDRPVPPAPLPDHLRRRPRGHRRAATRTRRRSRRVVRHTGGVVRAETLTIIWPLADLIAMNHERRMHYQRRAKLVRNIRAEVAAAAADIEPFTGRMKAAARFQWADKRRRDTSNLFPTLKAAVDGLTDAGVLPNGDDDRHVADTAIGVELPPNPALKGYARMVLTIEEVG